MTLPAVFRTYLPGHTKYFRRHNTFLFIHFHSKWISLCVPTFSATNYSIIALLYSSIMDEDVVQHFFLNFCVEHMSSLMVKLIVTNKLELCKKLWLKVHSEKNTTSIVFAKSFTEIAFQCENILPFILTENIKSIVKEVTRRGGDTSEINGKAKLMLEEQRNPTITEDVILSLLKKLAEWCEDCPGYIRDFTMSSNNYNTVSLLETMMDNNSLPEQVNRVHLCSMPKAIL